MKRKIFLLLSLFFLGKVEAQNYINILPEDNENTIVSKAANVRPTLRQLNWQILEVTGFLHFGINTFTGKEWGMVKKVQPCSIQKS